MDVWAWLMGGERRPVLLQRERERERASEDVCVRVCDHVVSLSWLIRSSPDEGRGDLCEPRSNSPRSRREGSILLAPPPLSGRRRRRRSEWERLLRRPPPPTPTPEGPFVLEASFTLLQQGPLSPSLPCRGAAASSPPRSSRGRPSVRPTAQRVGLRRLRLI